LISLTRVDHFPYLLRVPPQVMGQQLDHVGLVRAREKHAGMGGRRAAIDVKFS